MPHGTHDPSLIRVNASDIGRMRKSHVITANDQSNFFFCPEDELQDYRDKTQA
jgi:hypothetical protein